MFVHSKGVERMLEMHVCCKRKFVNGCFCARTFKRLFTFCSAARRPVQAKLVCQLDSQSVSQSGRRARQAGG